MDSTVQQRRRGIVEESKPDRGRIVPEAWRREEVRKQNEESEGETLVAWRRPKVYGRVAVRQFRDRSRLGIGAEC